MNKMSLEQLLRDLRDTQAQTFERTAIATDQISVIFSDLRNQIEEAKRLGDRLSVSLELLVKYDEQMGLDRKGERKSINAWEEFWE